MAPCCSRWWPALAALLLSSSVRTQTPLTTELVVGGLLGPVAAVAPHADPRLFIVELFGRVRVLKDGVLLPTPFLDLSSVVHQVPNQGLYNLAFHPDYAENGEFFVYYSNLGGNAVLARYHVSADPDVADPLSGEVMLEVPTPVDGHEGGGLAFGPDGYLYVGIGDGEPQGDPHCNGQNPALMLSKLLRLDVDGGTPYAVPADNPFVGDPLVVPEAWALGLRNPWRFSFDRRTGDLFLADVGHLEREELHFEPLGSSGGRNYGWPVMEGDACTVFNACSDLPVCGSPAYSLALLDYGHDVGCAIIGGYVYQGAAIPDLRGTYFFADFCGSSAGGSIYSLRLSDGKVTEYTDRSVELTPEGGSIGYVTSFGEDAAGELYVIAHYNGQVFKIVPDLPDLGQFVDLGPSDIPGTFGEPRFEGEGDSTPGSPSGYTLRCTRALPFAVGYVFLGIEVNPTPFYGGTFYPFPFLKSLVFGFDAAGSLTLHTALPAGFPGGLSIAMQFLFFDAEAEQGISGSNGLRQDVP